MALIDGTQKLTDDGWAEPYRQMKKWVSYIGDGLNMTKDEGWKDFVDGGAAIWPAGSWEISGLQNDVKDFEMGAFSPPVLNEGDQCYISDHIDMAMAINAGISDDSKAEAANTFLKWLGSEEFAGLFANALAGFFPLSNFPVEVDEQLSNEFIQWRKECESSIRPFTMMLSRGDYNLVQESFKATSDVMKGVSSPEEASATLQEGLESWYEPQQTDVDDADDPEVEQSDTSPEESTSEAWKGASAALAYFTAVLASLSVVD
jgi:raffinose/stachyose/melibiose transport system substrate-binding protein